MSVSVTNRHTSSFEISLTMACDPSDNMVESYTCDVSNRLGGDNQTHYIEGLQIECDRSDFVVGGTVTCNCSSEIEHSTVNWREQDLTNPEQAGSGVPSVVSLTVGPVTTDSQGEVFTCVMNSSCVAQEKTLTIDVTSKFCPLYSYIATYCECVLSSFQFLMSGLLLTSRTPLERMPSTTLTTS